MPTSHTSPGRRSAHVLSLLMSGAAACAVAQPAEEIVELTPFQINASQVGYFQANSMAGTRFSTKLEDIGASISILTKDQMQDFAMLDVNDMFLYVGNAEGTGTFTDFQIDRNGSVVDNVQLNPTRANRIRGMGSANISLDNFEMSGRIPLDPIGLDSVEVSRGPNANVFGLGNAAGTVNMVPSQANLARDRAQVSFRVDSYGGTRSSIDVNRVVRSGRFALRGSAVFQRDEFEREPSGTETRRFQLMARYRPFPATTLSASILRYLHDGNRPNSTTPRDAISHWLASGAPTWDPVTFTAKRGGVAIGTFPTATGLPDSLTNTGGIDTHANFFINENGLAFLSVGRTSSISPATPNQSLRLMASSFAPVRTNQPLFGTVPAVGSKDIYDYSRVNLAAVNRVEDRATVAAVTFDHRLFEVGRHRLYLQAGWLREEVESYARNIIGIAGDAGTSAYLHVDVNERMIDGSPNPNFLRPYLSIKEPRTTRSPLRWDSYRAQTAYALDFTRDRGWRRWIGLHQVSGYAEYKARTERLYSYRDIITSFPAWIPANAIPASQGRAPVGPDAAKGYFRYYVGDNTGFNVDSAPSDFTYGSYTLVQGNGATGSFVREPVTVGQAATPDVSGGNANRRILLKTAGAVVQSKFLDERIVTTLGVRKDEVYTRFGAQPTLLPDRLTFDYATMEGFVGDWARNSGRTGQAGIVIKPVRWLGLHANRSDSFLPGTPAQTVLRTSIPDPSGEGWDAGFTLALFDGKLVVRVNRYSNKQINAQDGQTGTLATRALRIDIARPENDPFSLQRVATTWITQQTPGISQANLDAELARVMGYSAADIASFYATPIRDTSDVEAKGHEIEVHYNPSMHLTLTAAVTETESIDSNLSPNLPAYIAQRLPHWEQVIDPRTGQKWFDTNYGGSRTARQYLENNVKAPLSLAQALEGKARSQVGKYAARLSGNYRLAGVFGAGSRLGRMNVGGALRWQDRSVIGYFGKQTPPASVTEYDPDRPIYDDAQLYVDLLVGYRTKLFSDKVRASFQLNVRNLGESGGLRPIGAFPDGTPNAFRIVDPRQFILSATFEL
jgi:outer membrane receptor protein involved in Fe transport